MSKEHVINACMDDDVPGIIRVLKDKGVDVSKCMICGAPIQGTEVPPRYLVDRIRRWFGSHKKFYEWNISAFVSEGVVCDKISCFSEMLYSDRMSRR